MFFLECTTGLMILAGCMGNEGGSGKFDLGEEFALKPGESARVGDNLRITFEGVGEDSRCPEGVQCITEGNARVDLEYISPDSSPLGFSLNTSRTSTRDTTLQRYIIALKALTPHPKQGSRIQPKEYSARLIVTEK